MSTRLDDTQRAARARLIAALSLDVPVASLEAQILLGQVLQQPRAYLMAHPELELPPAAITQFEALLARRLKGEPIAYILGQREFFGLNFTVTPDVLIPRPETELLVEQALSLIPQDAPFSVLDLGTGSGAIAISIAKHRPQAQVTAVDISLAALQIARQNAQSLNVSHIQFKHSDWFSALASDTRFELILANPPYIPDTDPHLWQGDVRFEPRQALRSGPTGLDAIRHIADVSMGYLKKSGHLLIEHGHDQEPDVREILMRAGWGDIRSGVDLAGRARMMQARRVE